MTALFLAAVIAVPFIWFVWRWRLRADRERPADLPAPGTPIADRINTATPETVRSADGPASVDGEEPPAKAAEKLEQLQPSAIHVVSPVEVQNELGSATQEFTESSSSKEDNGAKPFACGQTASSQTIERTHLNDGPLLPSIDTAPECEAPAAGVEISVIGDRERPETASHLPAVAAFTPGDGTLAGYTAHRRQRLLKLALNILSPKGFLLMQALNK